MTLKNRIAQLESRQEAAQPEAEPIDAERHEYLRFITSAEFVGAIMEKAEALLATMRPCDAAIVKSDCDTLIEKGCYVNGLVSDLFIEMLSAALEGRYTGPLSLAGDVMYAYQQHWIYKLSSMVCEQCGYLVPSIQEFGLKVISHQERDYSNLRCPLCGGLASIFRYLPAEPSKLEFTYGKGRIHKRHLMWIIGTVRKQDATV